MRLIQANESDAPRRRVYFHLVGTDGVTPAEAEAGGQPQISTDGGAWADAGVGTLAAIGAGRYYADLTQAAVATPGSVIETRYKSAATAECPGDAAEVVSYDPTAPAGGGGAAGPGADAVTLRFFADAPANTVPLPDADVWVTSDGAGVNAIAGPSQTNTQGEVRFLLDSGVTYFCWMQKDGFNSVQGSPFVAVAD